MNFESAIAQEKSARDALVRKTDITHHPLASEIWLEWGLFQAFRLNDEAGARAAWQAAARFDGAHVLEQATALTHRGQLVVATALLRAYLDTHDDRLVAHMDYGALLFVQGDISGAARSYETVLARDPENATAAFRLGVIYLRMNRPTEALELFRITRRHGTAQERAELDALVREFGLPDE